jgi:hypothetical protein
VGNWRKSQGNQIEIHCDADTGKKYFTPKNILEKNTKKLDKFKASQRKNSTHTASSFGKTTRSRVRPEKLTGPPLFKTSPHFMEHKGLLS